MAPSVAGTGAAFDITEDAFLGGALTIRQPPKAYRAGVDAVLLAAAAPVEEGPAQTVLDVGAGVGVVGLAVARRIADVRVVLVERDPGLAELACANVHRNGLGGRAGVVEADVTRRLSELPKLAARAESFDHVLANPPYHVEGAGTPAGDAVKAAAHAMPEVDLPRWVTFMASMARPGGSATVIHKPEALPALLAAMRGRFGGLKIMPVHSDRALPAIRILVQGIKGSNAPLRIVPALVLHEDGGGFTPEAERLLRSVAALAV